MRATTTSRARAKTLRGGFTLIELLISVTILAMMILATGIIITQADKVITISQGRMHANAEAAAIAQAIRNDIRTLVKTGGFLAIVAPKTVGNEQANTTTPGALIFTAMGSFASRSGIESSPGNPVTATTAVVCYTIRQDSSNGNTKNVLCRDTNLLAARPSGSGWYEDVMDMTATELSNLSRKNLVAVDLMVPNSGVIHNLAGSYASVAASPENLTEVQEIWPVIAANCVRFSVEWMDDSGNWHGFRYDNNDNPDDVLNPDESWVLKLTRDGTWQGKQIGVPTGDDAADAFEGDHNGAYIAMWSHHYVPPSSPKWPRAIKVRFTLTRQVKGETNTEHEYEVVCDLSQ